MGVDLLTRNESVSSEQAVHAAIDWIKRERNEVSTGFKKLDGLIDGLTPGALVVIGARPRIGKSTLAVDIVRTCARTVPTSFVSLEMSAAEVGARLLAGQLLIGQKDLRDIPTEEILEDPRTKKILDLKLFVDDNTYSLEDLIQKTEELVETQGLRVLIVDYLQLFTVRGKASGYETVTTITRELKRLAMQHRLTVIALSQLNRGAEDRGPADKDKDPGLQHLRESGSIEQDADVVLLLHRRDSNDPMKTTLIVAKNRHGPEGDVELHLAGYMPSFTQPG